MISKRNRRPARPQENLRQFSLNNSKGIDSTKSPTDFNTICAAENLVVNTDGSMSLRKPIEFVKSSERPTSNRRFYLYDNKHYLEVEGNSFRIVNRQMRRPVKVTYIGYDGVELSKLYDASSEYSIVDLIFPNGEVTVTNLSSATVLSNCTVDLSQFGEDAIDATLYDEVTPLPRYIQIHYDEDEQLWTMAVKSPEINTLTTAEGEIAFNPNMTLDNPLALRDTYGAVVPSIKGILAYVPSDIKDNKAVYDASITYPHAATVSDSFRVSIAGNKLSAGFDLSQDSSEVTSTFDLTTPVSVTAKNIIYPNSLEVGQQHTCKWTAHLSSNELIERVMYKVNFEVTFIAEFYYEQFGVAHTSERKYRATFSKIYSAEELHTGTDVSLECVLSFSKAYTYVKLYSIVDANCTEIPTEDCWFRVADITESSKQRRYRIVNAFKKDACSTAVLKAFCSLPNTQKTYYAAWSVSTDAIHWNALDSFSKYGGIVVRELDPDWTPDASLEDDTPDSEDYLNSVYYPLSAVSEQDKAFSITADGDGTAYVNHRIDVVNATANGVNLSEAQYRFRIIAVDEITSDDPEWDSSDNAPATQYRVRATVAQADYTPIFKNEYEFLEVDFGNTVYGKKLYNKKALYSYGDENFLNNIFVSGIDSFITPLYNVIDLDTHASARVSCLLPWRDYLVSATADAVYLHTKVDSGYLTKTVNVSVGIPEEDSRCCKAVLNGILFKSGSKIYQMYPNLYSGDDSTLNLTEISKAVEEYLENYAPVTYSPFAFSTESEYILMLPNESDTTCLRYDYGSKLWTVCTYPVLFTDYKMLNIDNIRLFGVTEHSYAEYIFDSSYEGDVYGDVLPDGVHPIHFEWDTGQKTDSISITKQFVESKIVFATEDTVEAFPMEITVAIDGDPHVTKLDLNSDAPFWKKDSSVGVANTAFRLGNSNASGVFRQLIVRYSGKGRSVRHILEGTPTSNFRLYETHVRYKTLNVKR